MLGWYGKPQAVTELNISIEISPVDREVLFQFPNMGAIFFSKDGEGIT